MEESNPLHNSLYQTEPEMSFFTSFNIDNDENDLNKLFPFDFSEDKYCNVIFPSMEDISSQSNASPSNESLMEKLTLFIDNYNMNFSSIETIDKEESMKMAENTLPGSIISLMRDMQSPVDEERIILHVKDKIHNFRKANGSRYNGEIRNIVNSALKTSGIFYRNEEGMFYYKEKEAMDFIVKNMQREKKKRAAKEKKDSKSKCSKKNNNTSFISSKSKNKVNEFSFSAQMNEKIIMINTVLEHMMKICRNDIRYTKLTKMNIEMLKEFCEEDKFIGMMMCIKYFKNLSKLIYIILYIVEKYLKYVSKKKNIEHFFDLNKINERILSVCSKIEQLDQNLNKNQQDIDNNSDKVCPMDICNSFNNSTYSTNNNIYFNISSLYTSNKEG